MKPDILLVFVGFALILTGLAVYSWPSALIVAGTFIFAAGLILDFEE